MPFNEGSCLEAAKVCFNVWLNNWGSVDRELTSVLVQVRAFLNTNGESRFVMIDSAEKRNDHRDAVSNKAGYRQAQIDFSGKSSISSWWVLPEGFDEMIRGYDKRAVSKFLIEKGYLTPGNDSSTTVRRDPLNGRNQRFYIINPKIQED